MSTLLQAAEAVIHEWSRGNTDEPKVALVRVKTIEALRTAIALATPQRWTEEEMEEISHEWANTQPPWPGPAERTNGRMDFIAGLRYAQSHALLSGEGEDKKQARAKGLEWMGLVDWEDIGVHLLSVANYYNRSGDDSALLNQARVANDIIKVAKTGKTIPSAAPPQVPAAVEGVSLSRDHEALWNLLVSGREAIYFHEEVKTIKRVDGSTGFHSRKMGSILPPLFIPEIKDTFMHFFKKWDVWWLAPSTREKEMEEALRKIIDRFEYCVQACDCNGCTRTHNEMFQFLESFNTPSP